MLYIIAEWDEGGEGMKHDTIFNIVLLITICSGITAILSYAYFQMNYSHEEVIEIDGQKHIVRTILDDNHPSFLICFYSFMIWLVSFPLSLGMMEADISSSGTDKSTEGEQ